MLSGHHIEIVSCPVFLDFYQSPDQEANAKANELGNEMARYREWSKSDLFKFVFVHLSSELFILSSILSY